jgi:hypothetical protein
MKIYVAKDFMWINQVANIYVFKGQMFMCDQYDLPIPVNAYSRDWFDFYSEYTIQQ